MDQHLDVLNQDCDRRNPEDRPSERIFTDDPASLVLTAEMKKDLWRHARRIILGNGSVDGYECGTRFSGYAVYSTASLPEKGLAKVASTEGIVGREAS